ncbi:outer membrane protein OmpA-like peptidoglycan-associated protein [Murinocardiopsis flavida]|uniref:Outer membrane protein OmpA-like peptidoglycan-associated protein n=1 Tax=Murinocardiopsis flavida TaxID=645275 RepID=A0A2P8DRW4_9ACTN|nr:OmpA family protein [Murinocardiopsis flavida]PSK99963.1 outer membrane protein OmpA-like peptidoglycan-associated protein [Murinocardiopsis flavida]
MNHPRTWIAAASALAVLLTACSPGGTGGGTGDGTGKDPETGKGGGAGGSRPLAATDDTGLTGGARTEITRLHRIPGDMVVLGFRITNTDDEPVQIYSELSLQDSGAELTSPSGAVLLDLDGMKHYAPRTYKDDNCFCSIWPGDHIAPDDSLSGWAAFPAPPKDVTALSVALPTSPVIPDVPLGGQRKAPEDPKGDLVEPRVFDLRQIEEDLGGGSTREDSPDKTNVMLSSDVLFDLNKSTLTTKADAALANVATEIDESAASEVAVDGYTDNSGDDAINQPLSEKRAAEVTKKLKALVERDGVEFTATGHGSADPVASNETDAGREKNRRVTVAFAK